MALAKLRFSRQIDADRPSSSRCECAALERLAHHPHVKAMAIGHSQASIVTRDEELLLAALAAVQRKWCLSLADHALLAELETCAAALSGADILLPLSVPSRALLETAGWIAPRPMAARRSDTRSAPNQPREGTMRSRAIALAKTRGVVSTREFGEIGISRQQVSTLCAQGHLRRVGYGAYAVA